MAELDFPSASKHYTPMKYNLWYNNNKTIRTVEELQQRITDEWERLDQRVIDNAVRQWRKHLSACVAANGGLD